MTNLNFEVVVVSYNNAEHIRPCLKSLTRAGAGIVVIDNGSRDSTREIIEREFPTVRLISVNENLGYGKALNLGISKTISPMVMAANADTVFPEGSVENLALYLQEHPRVGIVGPQQLFPNGAWQRSYGDVHGIYEGFKALFGVTSLEQTARRFLWRYLPARSAKTVGYVDGAVMMIRRAAFDHIGGFDEAFPYYAEDADFSLRLRRTGWGVISAPSVRVIHIRGGSSTKVDGYSDDLLRAQATAKVQLIRKHQPPWQLWLYRQISILHARKMWLIYRSLQMVGPRRYTNRASARASVFQRWATQLSRTGV